MALLELTTTDPRQPDRLTLTKTRAYNHDHRIGSTNNGYSHEAFLLRTRHCSPNHGFSPGTGRSLDPRRRAWIVHASQAESFLGNWPWLTNEYAMQLCKQIPRSWSLDWMDICTDAGPQFGVFAPIPTQQTDLEFFLHNLYANTGPIFSSPGSTKLLEVGLPVRGTALKSLWANNPGRFARFKLRKRYEPALSISDHLVKKIVLEHTNWLLSANRQSPPVQLYEILQTLGHHCVLRQALPDEARAPLQALLGHPCFPTELASRLLATPASTATELPAVAAQG